MIEQKITLKKHFMHIWPYMFFSIIMLFIILYDWANRIDNNKSIYIIYLYYGIVSFINIYLHFEYYLVNRHVTLFYDIKKEEIRYKTKNKEEIFILPESIKNIEICKSRLFKSRGSFLTTDNYYYYKFVLLNEKKIIITSLLYPEFEYKLEHLTKVKEMTVASVFIS
jgi:hypothetical protein